MQIIFEWDANKARTNFEKHKVGFDEARTIFNDPLILTISDPDHSVSEECYISIGASVESRLLLVVHTERGERNRLISCRKANNAERKAYENH